MKGGGGGKKMRRRRAREGVGRERERITCNTMYVCTRINSHGTYNVHVHELYLYNIINMLYVVIRLTHA